MAKQQQQGSPDEYQGPRKNRSCTDVICLLIFLVFIVLWAVIGIWAIRNGDPNTLLVPKDSNGLRCGLDETVKDYKYLFFFDLTECLAATTPFVGCSTKQVCVASCPNETYYYTNQDSEDNVKAIPYCEYDLRNGNKYDEEKCPKWFLPSGSFQKRCIPATNLFSTSTLENIATAMNDSSISISNINTAISNIKLLSEAEQFASQVINDLVISWWKILIGVGVALVICLIYIFMLRWIAGILVWISIVGVVAALAAGSYFSYITWQYWKTNYEENQLSSSAKTKRDLFLALFIIVVIVLGIILLVLIFLRKRIALAIALIKEGSRAVSSVTSVLFFPVFPWILQGGVIAYAVVAGVYLATTGEPLYQYRNLTEDCMLESNFTLKTECSPSNFTTESSQFSSCFNISCTFIGIQNDVYYSYLQAINVFGFFWLAFFVSALGQMVLAQVFAQWYWTRPKRNLPFFALTAAIYRTIRYHLGTLAFGSLIIAICRMIRLALEYIDKKLKKYDNAFTRAILCCLKCFFWCLENFLKFINKNAYIMCAIHGKNFCASAKDAFMLLMKNIVRVFVLDKVTDFLFFLSKLVITAGVGAIAYIFFVSEYITFVDNSEIQYGLAPVVAIMIVTYLIATLFFNVYSMAVDTLFLCFLEDSEQNNGKDRPYYMSRNLMKIFGKRNKGSKSD